MGSEMCIRDRTKTVLDREQRRRVGREVVADLRKWETRPSEMAFNDMMLKRLLEARTYADINRVVCILEQRVYEHTMNKLTEGL